MKLITSPENALFKRLLRVSHSARERKKAGETLLDGVHLVRAFRAHIGMPELIAVSRSGADKLEIQALLRALEGAAVVMLSDALFNQIAPVKTPVGILALVRTPASRTPPAAMDCCLLLEDIQDPGNLGSVLRSAAAAGVGHVAISASSTFAWAPRVVRAAMGGHFLLNIYEHVDLLELARGFDGSVVATDARAPTSVFDCDLRGPLALLIGNEGAGLSPALLELAHARVSIPMPGAMESLNAAAAAAICLFERVRQRGASQK